MNLRRTSRGSALAGLCLLGSACNLMIEPAEDKDEGPVHMDPKVDNDLGKELDRFFNGIAFGNNVISPEVWEGPVPVSTGDADAPVIQVAPKAVRVGPERAKATFPIHFTDITMLDPVQAPNRLVIKLRGMDWRWWEYPTNPQGFIENMPAGYEYSIWLRGQWQDLESFGTQTLEIAFAEESGKVGEFVPIEVTASPNAAAPYKDLTCSDLAGRLTREAVAESFGGDYACVQDEIVCRHTPALDEKCQSASEGQIVARGPSAESLPLAQASRGQICRSAYALKPYKYDDMTGMPFDPRPWDETLGSIETMPGCVSVLDEPGVKEDVHFRGFLCCQ